MKRRILDSQQVAVRPARPHVALIRVQDAPLPLSERPTSTRDRIAVSLAIALVLAGLALAARVAL